MGPDWWWTAVFVASILAARSSYCASTGGVADPAKAKDLREERELNGTAFVCSVCQILCSIAAKNGYISQAHAYALSEYTSTEL